MRVIGEKTLVHFCGTHADLREPADVWLDTVRSSTWRNPHELKNSFPSVSLLAERIVVFNLKGNRYRLIAIVDFEDGTILIERVGTHAEYSRIAVGLVKTDEELDTALEEVDTLIRLGRRRTPDQDDTYTLLALVIEYYESQKYPRVKVDPIRVIEFAMDQHNLRQRDLIPYLGSKSRVSEILNRKRKLTLKMMRKLHEGLGIPLEILVRDYKLSA